MSFKIGNLSRDELLFAIAGSLEELTKRNLKVSIRRKLKGNQVSVSLTCEPFGNKIKTKKS